ncbi:MAG: hypothetical protein HY894_07990 [Deltaproteobacteria bacterium]|nr:hypothetical protein [Deltaproteobacteria bacterium]
MSLRRFIFMLVAVFAVGSSLGLAAEKQDLSFWMKNTGAKLKTVTKKKKDTAVAGVKGAPEKASDDLYWKDGKPEVKEEEIDALEAAVEHVNKGETALAVKALEGFVSKYPKSPLKPDAEDGLKMLKAEKK